VVDGTALEMRRACKGSVGSNPTLSAIKHRPARLLSKPTDTNENGGPRAAVSDLLETSLIYALAMRRRRINAPKPRRPLPNRVRDAGSGTGVVDMAVPESTTLST
jgi:hypothetical protein